MDELTDEGRTFQVNCDDILLNEMISSALSSLCDPDNGEAALAIEADMNRMQSQIKLVERRQLHNDKMFLECTTKLDNFAETLKEAEKEHIRLQEEVKAASKEPSEITIEGSGGEEEEEDDDVQFIQSTYDPNVAIMRQGELLRQKSGLNPPASKAQTKVPSGGSLSSHRASLRAALTQAGGSLSKLQNPPRTIDNMRRVLAASLYKQSSTTLSQASSLSPAKGGATSTGPAPAAGSAAMQGLNMLNRNKTVSMNQYNMNFLANQECMEKMYIKDVNMIKSGSSVLFSKNTDIWEKATVLEAFHAAEPVPERRYKVRSETKKYKLVNAKQVAFADCINKPVTVGTRIVALYRDEDASEAFYAGIVAEAPNNRNDLRYLVFFDDGYAQYCTSKEIHKVLCQSKNVWEDIDPDSKEFVRDYLAQYPERPMVRLHKGQTVQTEWNGSWWTAKVDTVDASLVLMYFPADKRSEWIYRGSTRLKPLFKALVNAEVNRNSGKVRRQNPSNTKQPQVIYTRNASSENLPASASTSPGKSISSSTNNGSNSTSSLSTSSKPSEKKKPVARKSTTPSQNQNQNQSPLASGQIWEAPWMKMKKQQPDKKSTLPAPDKYSPSAPSKGGKDIASVLQDRLAATVDEADPTDLESLGTRHDQILAVKREKRKYILHKCSQKCLKNIGEDLDKLKGHNPLIIPLFCGWERLVAKQKPSSRRTVFYRTPCCKRLRKLEEVDKYLLMTNCKLSIDNFCFDPELHVHYEFIPVKTFCDIKDISYGKEYVPISCVNGIDRQYPDYVDYSNQRIPATGVKLNLDQDFLVCCDCKDNCRDSSKCACQQLTIESSAVVNGGKPITEAGYKHRRLPEPLLTGVFECNARCGCDRRCANKVVQNGLHNRLQVFKTEKRGWGLRCLDDIPKGGFICIYAGQLLTDQGANEDGQQYGDEYLAELDYIEVVERQKEGYESDVDDDEGLGKDEDDESEDSEEQLQASDSDDSFTASVPKDDNEQIEKSHQTRRTSRLQKESKEKREGSQSGHSEGSSATTSKTTAQKKTSSWPKPVNSPPPSGVVPGTDRQTKQDTVPDVPPDTPNDGKKRRTGRSSGARFGSLNPAHKRDFCIDIDDNEKENNTSKEDNSFNGPSTRDYFQDNQSCYIMDAKSMGNIGRYLNHSCSPCAFVQNVFVDTHDLRFPWIAFFAGQYISAGTELTWDYNYEVGSVPGKVLYCYCGSADCRGRLL